MIILLVTSCFLIPHFNITFSLYRKRMDILKKFINNPGLEHLAENIIGFLDTDQAMKIMIERQELSEDEREIFKKILKKLMLKEVHEKCEFFPFFEIFPQWKEHLNELKNCGTLESFNELYEILVLLQNVPEWCLNKKKCNLLFVTDVPEDMMGFLKIVVEIKDVEKFVVDFLKEKFKDLSPSPVYLDKLLSIMQRESGDPEEN